MLHLRFDQATTASRHHTSFPHAIQHLATALPLHSLKFALTSGRWRYGEWGTPLVLANPVGAVLDVEFHAGLEQRQLDAHWSALVHALSGLTCASVSLLRDASAVVGGRLQLQDLASQGAAAAAAKAAQSEQHRAGAAAANASETASGHRLHALLPHEALCTENLTPWLRLLPCRDQAGLAALLRHRPTVFGSEYVSLGLLVDRGANPDGPRGVRLVLSCTLVLRVPMPHTAVKLQHPEQQQRQPPLDLEHLLGSRVDHFCPAALRSQVFVAVRPLGAGEAAGGGGSCPWPSGSDAEGACSAAEGELGVSGEGDGGSTGVEGASDGDGGNGSARRLDRAPPQLGTLLAPLSREASGRLAGAAQTAYRALPYLRAYDTLDLLDVRGWGLHLSLLPLTSPSPSLPPAQQGGQSARKVSGPADAAAAVAEDGTLAAPVPADLTTERYATGAGLLRGGMVLVVRRSRELRERLAAAGDGCAGAAEGGGPGRGSRAVCLAHVSCLHQVFPWYVRPWVHTLEVLYDGKAVPLLPHLAARRLQPAVQRSTPGVLDLCLHVPPEVAELQLRLAFSKAFLTAFEYPPDAHRGFDVPAAVVSYVDPLHAHAPAVEWRVVRGGGGGGGGEAAGAVPAGGGGSGADGARAGEALSSPLLTALPGGAVRQVYTAGLLIPLAAPDFSMPYNVICLSSTLLAIYFGAVVNLLMRRGGSEEGDGAAGKQRGRDAARGKALQVAALVLLFGALALYLDAELRGHVEGLLRAAGVPLRSKEPVCGGSQPC